MRSLIVGVALAAVSTAPAFAATFVAGAGGPAVGISVGADVLVSDPIMSTDGITEYTFTFTALEDMDIVDFGVSGSALNADLLEISFNLDFAAPPPVTWTEFNGTGTSATSEFSDFSLSALESFTLTFFSETTTNANVTAFFTVASPTSVPLPAALPMLFGALGALTLARRIS